MNERLCRKLCWIYKKETVFTKVRDYVSVDNMFRECTRNWREGNRAVIVRIKAEMLMPFPNFYVLLWQSYDRAAPPKTSSTHFWIVHPAGNSTTLQAYRVDEHFAHRCWIYIKWGCFSTDPVPGYVLWAIKQIFHWSMCLAGDVFARQSWKLAHMNICVGIIIHVWDGEL